MLCPVYVWMGQPGVTPSHARPTPDRPAGGSLPDRGGPPTPASARHAQACAEVPEHAACAFGLAAWTGDAAPTPRYAGTALAARAA